MSDADRPSKTGQPNGAARVRFVERRVDEGESTKKKVIRRLKAMAPSLVASGSIVDARRSSLETPPPRRPTRSSGNK